MAVAVLSREDRDDGTTEVTLSQDGTRFTVVVPTSVDRGPTAHNVYQIMADKMVKSVAAVREIIRPGGEL